MIRGTSIHMAAWILSGLALWAMPAWAQTTPPIRNGQVEIVGALPRTTAGVVDVEALRRTIQSQFARPGVQEVQLRGVSLTEAEQRALFLNSDPNKNLLRQVSVAVPSPNGAERNVTFRNNDFRAKVGREEGQLRARIEGIAQSQLTETERQNLRAQFDRFRLEGAGNRGGRGGGDNSGPGSGNSGHGSDNSGPGSASSGSGRGGRDDVRNVNDDRREDRRMDRRDDRREDRQLDRREDRRADRQVERVARIERPEQLQRPERPERPQRPERPERPQRPERPERPERSGRN